MKFYCQSCNYVISVEMLATLDAGKCPKCKEIKGFATASVETMQEFNRDATMLNESDFLSPDKGHTEVCHDK